MEDSAFSDEFCKFLQNAVPSVEAAELLLLLLHHPDRRWSGKEAAEGIRNSVNISEADSVRYLESFLTRSLLIAGPDRTFQYRPASRELGEYVETLAQAYNERPVTLVRMIYALRDAKIKSFADAFRIRGS